MMIPETEQNVEYCPGTPNSFCSTAGGACGSDHDIIPPVRFQNECAVSNPWKQLYGHGRFP